MSFSQSLPLRDTRRASPPAARPCVGVPELAANAKWKAAKASGSAWHFVSCWGALLAEPGTRAAWELGDRGVARNAHCIGLTATGGRRNWGLLLVRWLGSGADESFCFFLSSQQTSAKFVPISKPAFVGKRTGQQRKVGQRPFRNNDFWSFY